MVLKDLTLEDLEDLSMVDIGHMILTESNKKIKIKAVFDKIAKLLKLTEKQKLDRIGDFYTAISTDKRFIILEDGRIDLKAKHSVMKVKVEDEDEDIENFIDEDDTETEEVDEEAEYNSTVDEEDDTYNENEDLKGLVIVNEEDMDS